MRLDGKKAVYKNVSEEQTKQEIKMDQDKSKKKKSIKKGNLTSTDQDPWQLRSKTVQNDVTMMNCPPLEMFFWNRIVVSFVFYQIFLCCGGYTL